MGRIWASFNNLPVRVRLVVLVAGIVVAMAAFLVAFFPGQMGGIAERWLERRAEVLAVVLSDAAGAYVEWDDKSGALTLLSQVGATDEIEYGAIRAIKGRPPDEELAGKNFAAWNADALPAELTLPGNEPVMQRVNGSLLVAARIRRPAVGDGPADEDRPAVGVLFLGLSMRELAAQRSESLRLVLIVSIGLALIGVAVAFGIGTIIVRPIQRLTQVTANIVSQGDLSQTIEVYSDDEVGRLAASFRAMVGKLKAIPLSLADLVESVTEVMDRATPAMQSVSDGASTVHARVADAASAMHEMTATLHSIAGNVSSLHQSAAQSTRSNQGVVAATRQITDRVVFMAGAADGANAAVQKMTAAIKEIAGRVRTLDASVETTVSSMSEMHASIASVERTAVEANDLSRQVAEDAVRGVAALERTLHGIGKITDSSASVSDAIESLGARIQNIGGILEVILAVASQTKLLALNAAILAAQAGEHGRGFGVLADQIKELAARTNVSATEIADLVASIQGESETALATMREGFTHVQEGARLGNEASDVLRKIERSANAASGRVQQITDAMLEQAEATKRVLASVDEIAATVQEVNRAAGEQAAGSEQVLAATMQMKSSTEAVRGSSVQQAEATQDIARSVATIHDMVAQLNRAQSEQTGTAGHTLSTVEAIKAVADEQLLAIADLQSAIDKLRVRSAALRTSVQQFRV